MAAKKPLFVYGTLLSDEVLGVLLGRIPKSKDVYLKGFHRFKLQGRVYPAITSKFGTLSPSARTQINKLLAAAPTSTVHRPNYYDSEEYEGVLVRGKLLLDLSEEELKRLDDYEGPEYNSELVMVTEYGTYNRVEAIVYTAGPSLLNLLEGQWSWEQFKTKDLAKYLGLCTPDALAPTQVNN